MKIKAFRGTGDTPRPDIISPLIANEQVALQRGRVEMDIGENGYQFTIQIPFNPGLNVSEHIAIYDENNHAFSGIITSIQHGVSTSSMLITELELLSIPSKTLQ